MGNTDLQRQQMYNGKTEPLLNIETSGGETTGGSCEIEIIRKEAINVRIFRPSNDSLPVPHSCAMVIDAEFLPWTQCQRPSRLFVISSEEDASVLGIAYHHALCIALAMSFIPYGGDNVLTQTKGTTTSRALDIRLRRARDYQIYVDSCRILWRHCHVTCISARRGDGGNGESYLKSKFGKYT